MTLQDPMQYLEIKIASKVTSDIWNKMKIAPKVLSDI